MDRSEKVRSLFFLLAIILGCMVMSNALSGALWSLAKIDLSAVLNGATLNENERLLFRLGLMINHSGTFILPALLYCFFFLKKSSWNFLRLNKKPDINSIILWGFVILFSYPFITQLTIWNMAIPLPDWMMSSQTDAFALLEQTLKMESILELIFSVLLIGVLASVGEELIFRGIIQGQLSSIYSNPHLAILVSALIFGGFHMQFERLLPLSMLGLILGYSYHYSKSLFVPVILHFINNSVQIFGIYWVTKSGKMPALDEVPILPWSFILITFIITLLLGYWAVRISTPLNESRS